MRNIIGSKPNQQTQVFDSWADLVKYVEETPSEMEEAQRASHRVGGEREQHHVVKWWMGEHSMKMALDKAGQGWKEGAAEIQKTFSDFNIPAKRVRQEIAYSQVGPGTLDMGRYIMGHPMAWSVWQDAEVTNDQIAINGGIVRLGINISQSAGVSATIRFNTGALILSLIDLLEQNNRRVELTLFNSIYGSNGAYMRQQVRVKEADESVNLPIMAFAFANAATQRRLCWAVRETLDADSRRDCGISLHGGYGQTDENWAGIDPEGVTLVKGATSAQYNNERRVAWLQAQLKEQGIEWDGK